VADVKIQVDRAFGLGVGFLFARQAWTQWKPLYVVSLPS
jgi:hypothetical protein